MRYPASVFAAALLFSAPLACWALSECHSGNCQARRSLDALADAPPYALGGVYENSRIAPGAPGGTQGKAGASRTRLGAPAAATVKRSAPDVPPAKAAEPEKEEGGIGGFLKKHKWQIGGAIVGALVTLAIGGGIFGILAGLAVSIAVAFLGPKIFSDGK